VITGVFIVELSLRWLPLLRQKAHWREFWIDWIRRDSGLSPMRILRFFRALRLLRLFRFGLLAHRFARTFEPRQYGDALREENCALHRQALGVHSAGPGSVRHAVEIAGRPGRVERTGRQRCAGNRYFITPFDVLPEEVYEWKGILTSVTWPLHVLSSLKASFRILLSTRQWEGEGTFAEVAAMLPAFAGEITAGERCKVHRYLGFSTWRWLRQTTVCADIRNIYFSCLVQLDICGNGSAQR